MIFIPYDKFSIETSLSREQTRKQIQTVIVANIPFSELLSRGIKNMFRKTGEEQFTGNVDDLGFVMRRVIYYRNSFRPIVKGRFEQGAMGTRIDVTMFPNPVIIVFMILWLVIMGYIVFGPVSQMISPKGFHPELLIPIVFSLFAFFAIQIGYIIEARKAKYILKNLFSSFMVPHASAT